MNYLNKHNLLNPRQSAYCSNHNIQSVLLRVYNIKEGIDNQLITIMILFDFSNAFDTVPHLRLLVKLKELDFSDAILMWIFSYLTGRSQAVDDVGNYSDWLSTSSRVSQGSMFGPILFALYINDIGRVLLHSNHMIFADDTQIYLSCPTNILHGLESISCDAHSTYNYANLNGLKLNLIKSKVLVFAN